MKRAVLIVNPKASRVTEEGISAVERALMRSAYLRTVRTERARHAVELAREAGDADALIVYSGDGGFNEALNGVEREDLPLGFVPGGGTSVLPRALGLPRDAVEAAEQIIGYLEERGRLAVDGHLPLVHVLDRVYPAVGCDHQVPNRRVGAVQDLVCSLRADRKVHHLPA